MIVQYFGVVFKLKGCVCIFVDVEIIFKRPFKIL